MAQKWESDVRPLVQYPASLSHGLWPRKGLVSRIEYIPWLSMNQEERVHIGRQQHQQQPSILPQLLTIKIMSTCQETGRERRKGGRVLEMGGFNCYLSHILGFSKLFVQYHFEGQSEKRQKSTYMQRGKKKKLRCYIPLLVNTTRHFIGMLGN